MSECSGKVYLVGAGPGDVAYLSVRAQQLLTQAEVLVYDALVDPQLLQLVPTDCLKLDVGKRGGQPSPPQTGIDQLLVEFCTQGKQVVRLKSGDPFIFGRTTSEIQALISAGCPFEVVPGISSALAAPLLAGIPLTDPVMSRCFAVMSAHEPTELDWETLAQIETLVILMGTRQLGEIIHQLTRHGRSLQTPVAILRWAGTPQQQVWTAPLGTILKRTAGETLSPAVIVVGEVVGLRDYLQSPVTQSSENRRQVSDSTKQTSQVTMINSQPSVPRPQLPLTGKTILVTRSAGQSSQFSERLQQEGATVIEMPTLEIAPPSSWEALDQAITQLSDFSWLILTSTNGVDYFFERLETLGRDARALANIKIAVVGEKTAQSLKQRCLQPDFIPPNFVADSLVEHFPEQLEGKKVLFPRVETGGRDILVKELRAKGADVIEVAAYQSRCPDIVAPHALEALQRHSVDVLTFASSKTVQCFCQLIEASNPAEKMEQWSEGERGNLLTSTTQVTLASILKGVCVASIGPQTSKTCQQLLGRVDIEAEEFTLEGLTQAIVKWTTA